MWSTICALTASRLNRTKLPWEKRGCDGLTLVFYQRLWLPHHEQSYHPLISLSDDFINTWWLNNQEISIGPRQIPSPDLPTERSETWKQQILSRIAWTAGSSRTAENRLMNNFRERKEKKQSHIDVGSRAFYDGVARYLGSNSIKLGAGAGKESHPQFSAWI